MLGRISLSPSLAAVFIWTRHAIRTTASMTIWYPHIYICVNPVNPTTFSVSINVTFVEKYIAGSISLLQYFQEAAAAAAAAVLVLVVVVAVVQGETAS